jgi:hypothetical protein
MFIIPLLLLIVIGYLCAAIALPWQRGRLFSYGIFTACQAFGLGCGITSCLYIFIRLFFVVSTGWILFAETVLLTFLFAYKSLSRDIHTAIGNSLEDAGVLMDKGWQRLLSFGLYLILAAAAFVFARMSFIMPHGGWDAWCIWNLLARFVARGGEQWADALHSLPKSYHADYPMLLPASVARFWDYIGNETQIVPIVIAFLFTFATVGLLSSALTILKGRTHGLLAGLFLIGTTKFIYLGASQCADVPLGFFFLATIVLWSFQSRYPEHYPFSAVAGMMAGFSCWTKNEGFLFLLAILIARILVFFAVPCRKTRCRQTLYFVAGTAPILVLVLYYKAVVAPSNDLVTAWVSLKPITQLMDPQRYLQVAQAFAVGSFSTMPLFIVLALCVVYLGTTVDKSDVATIVTAVAALSIVFSGYFLVFVCTPYSLSWHLKTSVSRLLLQLWPCFIFLGILVMRIFDRTPIPATESGAP